MAYTLFVVLIVLASLLMIFIVLIQESKGGGVRKTTDLVEKLTWGLAAAMVFLSVACAYVAPQAIGDNSVMEGATQEQTALPAMPGANSDAAKKVAPAAQNAAPAAQNAAEKAAPAVPATPAK